jgi:hypothetical protein
MDKPSEKQEGDINDLVMIMNNPRHEAELELPGKDAVASYSEDEKGSQEKCPPS